MERIPTPFTMIGINEPQECDNLHRVEVHHAGERGYSLFAKKDFLPGEEVWYVHGDTIAYVTDYTIPINENERVEPRLSGSIGQFMNHSCDPNMGPVGDGRTYVAIRPIKKGEELFTHYGFLGYAYGEEKSIDGTSSKVFDITCHCGAPTCKGVLGCFKNLTTEEREKWKNYILPFLFEKYTGI